MVSIVLGALLLVTGGLKAHGLYTDPYSQESILLTPRLLVAVIEVELLLGLWLLSGYAARAAWLAALAFFALLTAGSLYLAIEGQRSCGCFGRVEVNPWWTFGMDAGVVLLLCVARPSRSQGHLEGACTRGTEHRPMAAVARGVVRVVLGSVLFFTLIAGGFFVWHDNPVAALAQLRGERVTVNPVISDVGTGDSGEFRSFRIELTNHTDRPIRIVGGTTSCACITTRDLPIAVEARGNGLIDVVIKFTGNPGRFQHRFVLYTDDHAQPFVVARYSGRTIATTEPTP